VSQNTKHAGLSLQQLVNPFLEQLIEVDQDVAAQDNIEFIEGTICCQIMLEKTMFSLRDE